MLMLTQTARVIGFGCCESSYILTTIGFYDVHLRSHHSHEDGSEDYGFCLRREHLFGRWVQHVHHAICPFSFCFALLLNGSASAWLTVHPLLQRTGCEVTK